MHCSCTVKVTRALSDSVLADAADTHTTLLHLQHSLKSSILTPCKAAEQTDNSYSLPAVLAACVQHVWPAVPCSTQGGIWQQSQRFDSSTLICALRESASNNVVCSW